MAIQWTLITAYLDFEVAVVIIMILPICSPKRWNEFFKSRLFAMCQAHITFYFYVIMLMLCLLLFDAFKEMKRYAHSTDGVSYLDLSMTMKNNVKLFKAQRNFYITSFAIFLSLVIRRLATMLTRQYELSLKAEKIVIEAEAIVRLTKATSNTIQAPESNYDEIQNKLEITKELLNAEMNKIKVLEKEARLWQLKYKEAVADNYNMSND